MMTILTFSVYSMVHQIVIQHVHAVGMHHWGPRELTVGRLYRLVTEQTNDQDKNAIAVLEYKAPNTKRAYPTRESAEQLQVTPISTSMAVLRVEERSYVKSFDKGPQHDCLVMVKCQHCNILNIQQLLAQHHIVYCSRKVD
jgi:hypothetical protein